MFFIGATGQLITLILTVCVPFVFLLSGHRKTEIVPELPPYNISKTQTVVIDNAVDGHSSSVTWNIATGDVSGAPQYCRLPHLKLPVLQNSLIVRQVSLDASGNKAPPSFVLS